MVRPMIYGSIPLRVVSTSGNSGITTKLHQ
jgi:hypothetical protein